MQWEIVRQIEQGDTAFSERVDRFWIANYMVPRSNLLEQPLAAGSQIEKTKIKLWRHHHGLRVIGEQHGVDLVEFGRMLGHSYGRASFGGMKDHLL